MSSLSSALSTGLSGLNVNQTWLNVIGNNIANVNTTAFKESQVQFSSQFYVTDAAGSAPSSNFGGTNPSQQGLGATVAAITTNFSAGSIQPTGVDTDMAVNGSGFFITQGVNGQQFTRDGAFTLNSSNQLVTSAGSFVQGYGVNAQGALVTGSLQNIVIPLGQTSTAKATQNATLEGNLNASGSLASGASILVSQPLTTAGGTAAPTAATDLVNLQAVGSATPLVNAGDVLTLAGTKGTEARQLPATTLTVTTTTTVADFQNFINEGLGIDTTVAEAGNPTPGATLQTTGTSAQLTIVGNTGAENAVNIPAGGLVDTTSSTSPFTFTGGTDGTFTNDPTGESTHTTLQGFDSLGTPITVDLTAVMESQSTAGNTWRFYATSPNNDAGGSVVGNGTLTFDGSGNLVSSTGTTITIDRSGTGATTPVTMNLNFNGVTSLTSDSSQLVMSTQDGSPIGSLTSFSIGDDGKVTGSFSNGLTRTLGQLALANFNNPQGLVNAGSNSYAAGSNSGVPIISAPTTLGAGSVQAGSLEASNVDMSGEFINLIIASTGFSAASRVISTSNQLLTELLNTQQG